MFGAVAGVDVIKRSVLESGDCLDRLTGAANGGKQREQRDKLHGGHSNDIGILLSYNAAAVLVAHAVRFFEDVDPLHLGAAEVHETLNLGTHYPPAAPAPSTSGCRAPWVTDVYKEALSSVTSSQMS